jgi:DNA repair protein RecO (recombination protein O)
LHRDFIAAADAARISTLMRMNYDTMHLFRMSRDDRNRIVDVLLTYYKMHVPNFPELRSLAVVKQLFEDK